LAIYCSSEAGCPVIKEGILDRHYYDESILKRVEEVAEKQLGRQPNTCHMHKIWKHTLLCWWSKFTLCLF